MTVTFDAVANLGTANSTSGLSAPYTLGGSATALCVAVGGFLTSGNIASLTTRTVTVGGKALTLLASTNNSSSTATSKGWTELWGIIGPPTGLQTVQVIENATAAPAFLNVTAVSFNGVSQFGTGVVNVGTATTASAVTSGAMSSSTGSRVLTVGGATNATLTLTGAGTQRSDMPATTTANYTTLLLQDQAGATTVTNTATYAGTLGWGVCSVNLVAGSRWSGTANASLGLSSSATASFVGATWSRGATASMGLSATASATVTPLGPALRYVGRPPDNTGILATAQYAQKDQQAFLVTPSWVTQQITQATANLVTQTWIDEHVANYATQTQVQNTLAAFLPTTALGASIGQLDSNGFVPSGQLPTVTTNSLATSYNVTGPHGTVYLPPGQSFVTQTSNLGELKLGTIDIPDPGYPYVVFPFAWVLGWSGANSSGSNLSGNANVGLLAVTPVGKTVPLYGVGLCTADTTANLYPCVPCAVPSGPVTPTTQPPIVGDLTLELSACNWTGADYTFSGTGMVFFVIVTPGLGG